MWSINWLEEFRFRMMNQAVLMKGHPKRNKEEIERLEKAIKILEKEDK